MLSPGHLVADGYPSIFNTSLCLCLLTSGPRPPWFQRSPPPPGLLGPLSILLLGMVALLEEGSSWRPALCSSLITVRYIIGYAYFNTLYFSLVFRSFLVLCADRGLVSAGRPSLVLFHRLFWICIGAFCTFNCGLMPVSHLLRDWREFPRWHPTTPGTSPGPHRRASFAS